MRKKSFPYTRMSTNIEEMGENPHHLATIIMLIVSSRSHQWMQRLVSGNLRLGQYPISHQRSSHKTLLNYKGENGRLLHL